MSKLKILVAGAAVAGPTIAYWFARAGASVIFIERFSELRSGGHYIDIRTVGVTTMRRMPGIETAVRAKIAPLEGLSFVRSNGRPYGIIRATGNPDQQSLVWEYKIFRGNLSKILYDKTKDNENIKYVSGDQVASLQQNEKDDGPITVEFANGFPTSKYDLVVACDGATSRTRAMGLGCGIRDHIQCVNAWTIYFSIRQDLLDGSKIGLSYSETSVHFVSVKPVLLGVNRVTLMGIYPRDDCNALLPFREASKQ